MDLIKGFFKGEYATDTQLTAATDLREDLWLDFLALEELGEYLRATVPTFKADWDSVRTLGDLAKLLPASHAAPVAAVAVAPVAVPQRGPEALKLWFPVVIDRFKEKRQQDPAAVPLIGFYHAGGAVANLRPFAKELDAVMGSVAVNPMFVELPGRGVRGKDALLLSCRESSREIAAVVASQVLGGDRRRKFAVFGHSVGTLHAFEVTRELERLGFVPRALVVLNRQAPQIAMDRPEDNFGPPLTDEQFIAKMSSEYNQKTLADLWKTHPEIVKAGIPASRADMTILTSYRLEPEYEKLKTAIVCVASAADRPSNSEAAVAAWREVTTGPFSFRVAKGAHFAYSDDPKSIMPWIGQELQVRR